jgi:hypothetical protein
MALIALIDPVGRMIRGAIARVSVEWLRGAGSVAKEVARRAANSLLRRKHSLIAADKFPLCATEIPGSARTISAPAAARTPTTFCSAAAFAARARWLAAAKTQKFPQSREFASPEISTRRTGRLHLVEPKGRRAASFAHGASFDMMIVPDAANIPPTPWQTEIFAPGTWAGAIPRIWRTLSCKAYMPYMPECM